MSCVKETFFKMITTKKIEGSGKYGKIRIYEKKIIFSDSIFILRRYEYN